MASRRRTFDRPAHERDGRDRSTTGPNAGRPPLAGAPAAWICGKMTLDEYSPLAMRASACSIASTSARSKAHLALQVVGELLGNVGVERIDGRDVDEPRARIAPHRNGQKRLAEILGAARRRSARSGTTVVEHGRSARA